MYVVMPFGLCNAPATFQRCMMAIFTDLVEEIMDVFMDDFSVYGNSFEGCLSNLEQVLVRCEEMNLVLNWEKCHFMVDEGIVLGHRISAQGIQVDKAKVKEIREAAYENSRIYKERTKRWHDARVRIKEFKEGDQVLLFNSRLKLFPGKLKSHWTGPYTVLHSYPYGAVELCNKKGDAFKANGQRLKLYHGGTFEEFHQFLYLMESTG